jgi:hypothetical protein
VVPSLSPGVVSGSSSRFSILARSVALSSLSSGLDDTLLDKSSSSLEFTLQHDSLLEDSSSSDELL